VAIEVCDALILDFDRLRAFINPSAGVLVACGGHWPR